jgi:hypothetical protein
VRKQDVTVCTTYYKKPRGLPTALVRTCSTFKIKLHEFGTGRKFVSFLETKLIPLRDFVSGVKTKYVLFLDGNDTFLVSPLEEIMATYEKLTRGKIPLIISSELKPWPYTYLVEYFNKRWKASGSKSPFRYVDPGLVLGETDTVFRVLDQIVDSVPYYREQLENRTYRDIRTGRVIPKTPEYIITDDVGLWCLNMKDGRIDTVIDYGCEIMAPLMNCAGDTYWPDHGKLYLKLTKTCPHIVHCNGGRSFDRKRLPWLYKAITGFRGKIRKLRRPGQK